ncbi:g7441 [Coccomyxa viridis]|uniref:G7441 protein n=1 Tax=Coccomyxa viridis TaxID=1274662 RepID=A0ABP1FXU6_9CHLO
MSVKANVDTLSAFEVRGFDADMSHSEDEHDRSGSAEQPVVLADGEVLPEVLAWFRDVSDTDRDAALIFPPSLSKEQRAAIHTLVQTVGLGALASVSKGLGESRHITVVRTGHEDSTSQDQLDEIQRHKAIWIFRRARSSGLKTSRDEIAEMVLHGCLTPVLEQLWEQGRAKQKLVIRLCDTVVDGSPEDLKELLGAEKTSHRDVLREGICDLLTMRAPLHCAARLGKVLQLELLLEAGAPVDCLDGHGWTALQVARQHPEQWNSVRLHAIPKHLSRQDYRRAMFRQPLGS